MSTAAHTFYTRLNDFLTHCAFVLWAIAAVYFYQERLYSDSAFYLGKVIHYEQFWVELSRYVLVFSQWLPLLCVKLGASMKVVLLAYSLGHVLFFYAMYWVGRYCWGSPMMGWFLVGSQTIGLTQGFATPMFELYYTAAFLGWWMVLLYQKETTTKALIGLGVLAAWVTLNYMLCMWLLGGMLVLHRLRVGWTTNWPPVWATVLGMGGAFVLKQALTHHSYEEAKMDYFVNNLLTRSYTWTDYWRPLLDIYWQHYTMLSGLAVFTVLAYGYQRRYGTAAGYVLWILVTQYIVALTYPHIAHSRYQEQCYFIAVMAILLPLLLDVVPQWQRRTQTGFGALLFGMVVIGLGHIEQEMDFFTQRVAYLHRLIAAGRDQGAHKLIIEERHLPPFMHGPSFTFSVESMLLSALTPGAATVHLIRDTEWADGRNAQTLQDSTLYLSTFRSFYDRPDSLYHHQSASKRYFNFPPAPYRPARGRYSSPDSLAVLKDSLHLTADLAPVYPAGSSTRLWVTLHNPRPQGLGAAPLHFSYHWWTEEGELVQWDHGWTALEVDVPPQGQHAQPMILTFPAQPGDYRLQLDLIGENGPGWLHHPTRLPVRLE